MKSQGNDLLHSYTLSPLALPTSLLSLPLKYLVVAFPKGGGRTQYYTVYVTSRTLKEKGGRFIYEVGVGRINGPPKDVYVLILKACEYTRLHGKRDPVDVIKLRIKLGGYPGVSRWVQCNHIGLYKMEEGGRRVRTRKIAD